MVDAKGSVFGSRVLFPFGGTADQRGQAPLRGIIGVHREIELDLAVFDARYLHEATGRFLSPDPILLHVSEPPATPQALNAFSYAMNRPLTHIDPDGRIAVLAVAGVAVAVAGAFGTGYSIGSMANATYDRAVGNISWSQYGKTMALNGAGFIPAVKFAQVGRGAYLTATRLAKVPLSKIDKGGRQLFIKVGKLYDKTLQSGMTRYKAQRTRFGHALQKHRDRPGEFSNVAMKGKNPVADNAKGLEVFQRIMKGKYKTIAIKPAYRSTPDRYQIFDMPTGRGVSLNKDGSFRGFLEHSKEIFEDLGLKVTQ